MEAFTKKSLRGKSDFIVYEKYSVERSEARMQKLASLCARCCIENKVKSDNPHYEFILAIEKCKLFRSRLRIEEDVHVYQFNPIEYVTRKIYIHDTLYKSIDLERDTFTHEEHITHINYHKGNTSMTVTYNVGVARIWSISFYSENNVIWYSRDTTAQGIPYNEIHWPGKNKLVYMDKEYERKNITLVIKHGTYVERLHHHLHPIETRHFYGLPIYKMDFYAFNKEIIGPVVQAGIVYIAARIALWSLRSLPHWW